MSPAMLWSVNAVLFTKGEMFTGIIKPVSVNSCANLVIFSVWGKFLNKKVLSHSFY